MYPRVRRCCGHRSRSHNSTEIQIIILMVIHTPPTILAIIYITSPLNYTPLRLSSLTTMSTEPAEPNTTPAPTSATAWIQSHLTALYEDIHTQDAFDRAFSPACDVRVNHEIRGVQALREDLAARRTATTHVHIAWDPSVVSTNEDKPDEVRVWDADGVNR